MIRNYRVSIDFETERGCTAIDRRGTHDTAEGASIGYEIGLDIAVLIEQLASDLTQKEHDDVHKAVSEYHVNFPKRTLESQMDTHIAVQEVEKLLRCYDHRDCHRDTQTLIAQLRSCLEVNGKRVI